MVRLKRADFERPEQLAALAVASGLGEMEFVARFGYLIGDGPARRGSV